jgi:hypothetical protein
MYHSLLLENKDGSRQSKNPSQITRYLNQMQQTESYINSKKRVIFVKIIFNSIQGGLPCKSKMAI